MFSTLKSQTHSPASSTPLGKLKTTGITGLKAQSRQGGMTSTIDDLKFVKAWMSKQTIDEVCRKMHITPQRAYSKANSLRKKGVNLPKKHRLHVPVDKTSVEELNKLIERMSK